MIRKIIRIDEALCNGCGLCAAACHEGAIGMANGKARLLREDYCDGLGDCLPACPVGAITFEERDVPAYDPAAVQAARRTHGPLLGGCPGTHARALAHDSRTACASGRRLSELRQWPVQLRLVPGDAPYFQGAHLLVAADCAAYACGDFHREFMKDRVTLIGCPKLDDVDYTEKLTQILIIHDIRSVTVARMEVPCCRGLEQAVKTALQASGKEIPLQVAVLSTDGRRLDP